MKSVLFRHRLLLLLALLALGVGLTVFVRLQRTYAARVVEVGEVHYSSGYSGRKHRRRWQRYKTTLTVRYTDDTGAEQSARFVYTTSDRFSIPQAGQTIQVVRSLTGITAYPNRTLQSLGMSLTGVAGLLVFTDLCIRWTLREKKPDKGRPAP